MSKKQKPWFGGKFRAEAIKKLALVGVEVPLRGVKNHELYAAIEFADKGMAANDILRRLKYGIDGKLQKLTRSGDFYDSDEWKQLRYTALQKYGAACHCCGATRADGVKMHVDHIKPRSKFPELALKMSNLQILCEDCNKGKGAWDDTDWRNLEPGRGRLIWGEA